MVFDSKSDLKFNIVVVLDPHCWKFGNFLHYRYSLLSVVYFTRFII